MSRWSLAAGLLTVAACRPDPGAPNYPNPGPWDPAADDPDFLSGSDPYEEGEARLSMGIFYEGGASDALPIDDLTRHFYIYEGSFGMGVSDDRVEGLTSDEITVGDLGWWGGGVHWDTPEDLSAWTTLHLALQSNDPAMETWTIGMSDGVGEGRVGVGDLGFVADGYWHELELPLALLASSVDLEAVTVGLLMVGATGEPGATVKIDDLYLTAE